MVKNFSEEAFTPGVGASSAHSGHSPAHREDAPVDAVPAGAEPDDGEGAGAHVAAESAVEAVPREDFAGPSSDDGGAPDEAPVQTEALAAVVAPERPSEVTVEEGETLESIAVRWGVDVDELAALNAWLVPNPRTLFPGQILRLPA